jgi:hypothetical protein
VEAKRTEGGGDGRGQIRRSEDEEIMDCEQRSCGYDQTKEKQRGRE